MNAWKRALERERGEMILQSIALWFYASSADRCDQRSSDHNWHQPHQSTPPTALQPFSSFTSARCPGNSLSVSPLVSSLQIYLLHITTSKGMQINQRQVSKWLIWMRDDVGIMRTISGLWLTSVSDVQNSVTWRLMASAWRLEVSKLRS